MGGNLSILASLCGTSYGLNPKNVLLFLEEIGEKPYRIDRMMTQLRQGNILNKVNGCLLGQFKDCDSSDKITSHSLDFTLRHQCIQAQVKTLCNLPFGHIEDTWTLPIGIMAEFDLESYTIQLLESSTSSV